MLIELPWPPRELRTHAVRNSWPRIRATKKYRALCHSEAIAQGIPKLSADRVKAFITLFPPHRRGDKHNDEAAFKAGIDGVADRIGVDDRCWDIEWRHGEPVKNGAVIIELEAL